VAAVGGNLSIPLGIEACVTQNPYYMPMRRLFGFSLAAILTAMCLAIAPGARVRQSGANAAPSHDGVTVTAQPWTDPALYKPKFPKKTPLAGGVVGVQFTLQNDSADALRVNLERVRLVVTLSEDSKQSLAPLSPEDVAEAVFTAQPKDPTTRRRLPIPTVGKVPAHRSKEWTEFEQACRNSGVPSSVVAGHSSVQGLLFFDLGSQLDLLATARLYVPELIVLEKAKPLVYFEVELAKPAQK